MKSSRIVALAALAALACSAAPEEPVAIGPRVEFVAFEGEGDERVAVFRFANGGPGAVEYFGSLGDTPSIELQSWRDGAWKRTRFAWCTDGLDWLSLREGEAVTIDVRPTAAELPLRLGVTVRRGGETEQVWSGRVDHP